MTSSTAAIRSVAIVGGGVSGISSALAIAERYPHLRLTILSNMPFNDTTSYGPAGLFRLDNLLYKELARTSFKRFEQLHRSVGGSSGIQLVSGYVLSDDIEVIQKQLGDSFDIIINCAGINGGRLSGDDNTVIPIRGILIEVDAPWHKHFLYRDLVTISIPTTNSLFVGTVKQNNRNDMIITDDDRIDIWGRVLKLIPTLKDAKVINEWIGLRPERNPIRLESQWRQSHNGRRFQLVHNYGHGGNGFTLSWGCAMQVVQLIGDNIDVLHRSSSGNVISRL